MEMGAGRNVKPRRARIPVRRAIGGKPRARPRAGWAGESESDLPAGAGQVGKERTPGRWWVRPGVRECGATGAVGGVGCAAAPLGGLVCGRGRRTRGAGSPTIAPAVRNGGLIGAGPVRAVLPRGSSVAPGFVAPRPCRRPGRAPYGPRGGSELDECGPPGPRLQQGSFRVLTRGPGAGVAHRGVPCSTSPSRPKPPRRRANPPFGAASAASGVPRAHARRGVLSCTRGWRRS